MTYVYHTPPLRPHGSQFIKLNDGSILKGGCTILALAAGDIISKGAKPADVWVLGGTPGDPASVANVQAVMKRAYYDALAHGNCGSNGSMRQVDVLNEAKRIGLPVKDKLLPNGNYAPLSADVVTKFIRKYNAADNKQYGGDGKQYAILWQFADGEKLHDALGGGSDEAGLKVHADLSYGTYTDDANIALGGYVFADGDSSVANSRPSVYALPTFLGALPITAVVFGYVHDPFVTPPAPKPTPAPTPTPAPDPLAPYRAVLQTIITEATAALKG